MVFRSPVSNLAGRQVEECGGWSFQVFRGDTKCFFFFFKKKEQQRKWTLFTRRPKGRGIPAQGALMRSSRGFRYVSDTLLWQIPFVLLWSSTILFPQVFSFPHINNKRWGIQAKDLCLCHSHHCVLCCWYCWIYVRSASDPLWRRSQVSTDWIHRITRRNPRSSSNKQPEPQPPFKSANTYRTTTKDSSQKVKLHMVSEASCVLSKLHTCSLKMQTMSSINKWL